MSRMAARGGAVVVMQVNCEICHSMLADAAHTILVGMIDVKERIVLPELIFTQLAFVARQTLQRTAAVVMPQ